MNKCTVKRDNAGKFSVGHSVPKEWKEISSITNRSVLTISKICTECKKEKPLSEFHKRNDRPVGTISICKPCAIERHRIYIENNPEKVKINRRKGVLKKQFNLIPEEWEDMRKSQRNKCAICGKKFKSFKSTHVDHNHKTGIVRALLCENCNHGIGNFKDNPEILKKAYEYILKWY